MSKSFKVFRVMVTLQGLAILGQAISAGMLLASTSGGRTIHGSIAMAVVLTGLLQLVTAILVWRPGGGPARWIGPSTALVVLAIAQMVMGVMKVRIVHVPLGVLLWGGILMLLVQVWSRQQGRIETRTEALV